MNQSNKTQIEIVIECPHCSSQIIIEELNCCIFRHGILKESGKQIDPHSSEELCNYYVNEEKIYGCGKPFRIHIEENKLYVSKCGYI